MTEEKPINITVPYSLNTTISVSKSLSFFKNNDEEHCPIINCKILGPGCEKDYKGS